MNDQWLEEYFEEMSEPEEEDDESYVEHYDDDHPDVIGYGVPSGEMCCWCGDCVATRHGYDGYICDDVSCKEMDESLFRADEEAWAECNGVPPEPRKSRADWRFVGF